jgi:WD40 repeat protein
MSCDVMQNDENIIVTSMNGEVSVFSTKTGKRTFLYETIPLMIAADKKVMLPDNMQESLVTEKKIYTPAPKRDDEYSNIMYISRAIKNVPGEEGTFLVGAQDKTISKFKIEGEQVYLQDQLTGHSMGLRSLEMSKDGKTLASGCDDHSLRLWDYGIGKANRILAGHHDVVVS